LDGFELCFAVNHLAHFHLAERLVPAVKRDGRIVITSSEVHDPHAFCMVGITRAAWEDPLVSADPRRAQGHLVERIDRGEARYCASKLLNLMHARHLAQTRSGLAAIAFNPSVVPGTEIARERNLLQIFGWKFVLPLLVPVLPWARSMDQSAGDLVWLMTEADGGALSGQYVNGRTVEAGSFDSRDPVKIARMAEVSHDLIASRLAPHPATSSAKQRGIGGRPTAA
jgi:NAD(P)-dependent dehydrogenase (short-subunit alcohol dehydrogenase family)